MSDFEFDYDVIRNAIAESTEQGALVTKYTLVATVIDEDGTESIQTISDCDHSWQVLGMLHHALLVTAASRYGDDEDDDEGDDE